MVTPDGRTHYEVLGIDRTATVPQVERAYRYWLEMYGEGSLATYSLLDPEEQRRARERVREAYEILHDPARRRAYDLSLARPVFRPREPPPAPGPAAEPPAGPEAPPEAAPEPAAAEAQPWPEAADPAAPVPPVRLDAPVTGAVLRRFRESRRVSLEEIAMRSKISARYLRYIEEERFDMLPPPVYLRGFLQEYARGVGLDPRATAEGYLTRVPHQG